MQITRYIRRALGALLISCTAALAVPSPASAACVVGYLVVHYEQAPDQVLLHPSQCLVPTPFPNYPLTGGWDEQFHDAPVPQGTPTGVGFHVWIPA